VKISFDTNSDSYDDALSALNAAYGVESVSASSLDAIARSDMGTVPMTKDELEVLWRSMPLEYRTSDFYGNEEVDRVLRAFGSQDELRSWVGFEPINPVPYEKEIAKYLLSSSEIDLDDFIMYKDIRNWQIDTRTGEE